MALRALSCWPGSSPVVRQFGPLADLQVSACAGFGLPQASPRSRESSEEAAMKDKPGLDPIAPGWLAGLFSLYERAGDQDAGTEKTNG
jgi:hypothetical protein